MLFARLVPSVLAILATVSAGGHKQENNQPVFKQVQVLCPGLQTEDNGCTRYTQGFDITGIVTTVQFFFPEVKSVCDCIQKCLDNPTTCANYIWDFHNATDIANGHRTCIIYSNFNLPSNVTVVYAPNDPQNVNIQFLEDTVQMGSTVPQAFTDVNGTVPDDKAFSGPVWQLSNGSVQC
ncbi:hypothetical protein EHS25_005771 [Saitozyma podzolica]|uniref:Apple domain-containing protein n=1 Tax=Saitozyma podzolica TaxID=1890683 RepID=A0A427XWC3_9TREE|nr:hypothetical protein EHS25_005771 [Saitozyma podzolica]